MRRLRRRARVAALLAAGLALTAVLPVQALPPIDAVSTAGIHIQTVPTLGASSMLDIADNGWVANPTGVWEGIGYPIATKPDPSIGTYAVRAIGADGTIVGTYGSSPRRIFVRNPDGTVDFPPSPPGFSGQIEVRPESVSDEGHITGIFHASANSCGPTTTGFCSFLATPLGGGSYSMTTLPPTPTGGAFFATAVGGTAAGGIVVGGGGYTWTAAGGYVVLTGGVPRDINRAGAMTGTFSAVNGAAEAAFWSDRSATAVVIPGLGADTFSAGSALNEANQVVGWSGTSSSPNDPRRAFLWDSVNGTSALGELPGGTESEARGITEDGKVGGVSDNRAVIWDLDDDYDIDDPPDVAVGAAVTTVEEGDELSLPLTISDPEGDPFTVAFDGLPAAATWDESTSTLRWPTTTGDAGRYLFTITVAQVGSPLNAWVQQALFDVLVPMVLAPIGDQFATVGDELTIQPELTDGRFPTFQAYSGEPGSATALPTGAAIVRNTGTFTWTPTLDQVGDHVITIEANETFSVPMRTVLETFTVTVSESGPLTISISESVVVTDDVTVQLAIQLVVSESVMVTDVVVVRPAIQLSITETVVVTDTVVVRQAIQLVVSESVVVTDDVAAQLALQLVVSESVAISDTVDVQPEPPGRVSGVTWIDLDGDGTRDINEPGVSGVRVYVDVNLNSRFDAADVSALSAKNGNYVVSGVLPGSRRVRAVVPAGHGLTKPSQWYTVPVVSGATAPGRDFGLDPNGYDGDFDGIVGSVDGTFGGGGFVSRRAVGSNDFTDQHRAAGATFGVIADRSGLEVAVSDAVTLDRGVRVVTSNVAVETFAELRFCGRPERVEVRDQSAVTFTCGSLLVEVDSGLVRVATSDGATITIGGGSSVLIDEVDGAVTVESLAGSATVTANGSTTILAEGTTITNPGGPVPGSQLDRAAKFVPLSPVRLFDTRPTEPGFGPKGKLTAKSSIDVQVGGRVGVPVDAVAVVMNVTVAEPDGASFATVYPTGSKRPLASSVNIVEAGQVRPNLVTVKLGDEGKVTMYSLAGSHLLADVAGYYIDADTTTSGGRFVPLTPQRLFDTRPAEPAPGPKGRLGAGDTIVVETLGVGQVPAVGVAALVINVTAVDAGAAGFVTVFPTGEKRPLASNVNLDRPGAIAPNLVIVPIGDAGTISLYSLSAAHLLGDVTGYITNDTADASTDGLFVPLEPRRVFDTREEESPPGPKGYVPADGSIAVDVAGTSGVPADAAGVVLNVTGIASPLGYLTAWERGPKRPVASVLNFAAPLDTRANAAMLPVGVDGQISFYTLSGSDILADVSGYFLG